MPASLRRFLRKPAVWWTGFALWFVTLQILSSLPPPPVDGPEIPHLDKLAHFVYFSLGAVALGVALTLTKRRALRFLPWGIAIVVAIAAVGALDEWRQTFNPDRHGGDMLDWSADFLGACLGAVCSLRFSPRFLL